MKEELKPRVYLTNMIVLSKLLENDSQNTQNIHVSIISFLFPPSPPFFVCFQFFPRLTPFSSLVAFKEQLKADEATKNKAEKKAKKELEEERNKPVSKLKALSSPWTGH